MGDENGFSEKLPDGYVMPVDELFPTVVCESGFAESMEDLKQDARLWLLHTGGATRVVIVVCMKEIIATQGVSGDMEKRHTSDAEEMAGDGQALGIRDSEGSSAEETAGDGQALGMHDLEGTDEEATVLNSIDQTTQRNCLAKELAAEDNTDIVEAFTATLLPQPPADSPEPKEFPIPLHDILGTSARGRVLREFMEGSIPHTKHFRAVRRAKKLLKSRVGLDDEEETFAKRKRQRLSPIGIWK
ncbi:unnamed protein product [Tuber aestivum]|uniref:Uncharacterized protein n=1 Tax=Tuber aestivum TaxID=59557 RepID=A0A292PMR7_9PEZI|nr:unnamed protein product [Tuber aestivum]